jgi:hypothetical protein
LGSRTGNEIKEEYCKVLGTEFGNFFYEIYTQTVWLFVEWEQYKKLYTKEETVEVLNNTASSYFALQQRIQWNSIVLNIARLTDEEKLGKYENLTYLKIPDYIEDEEFKQEIKLEIMKLKKEREDIKKLRHKILAHNDLECILYEKKKIEILNTVTLKKAETVLSQIENIFQMIYSHYFQAHMLFKDTLFKFGAGNLVYWLKTGLLLEKIRTEQANYDPKLWDE